MSITQLEVRVGGEPVATLSSADGFEYHLTYAPGVTPEHFVSLLMPVRPQSWSWPALPPFFHMNLPEGYLLSVLKELLGPRLGANPLDLLAVVGGNMIGRVQLFAPDTTAGAGGGALDLKDLLGSPGSLKVFHQLLREYATSGVSGVVPKFLSPELQRAFRKASVATDRYIIKASAEQLPFLALNEHLCMRAAERTGAKVAHTEVSQDGQVLAVERFDIAPAPEGTAAVGGPAMRLGFEDLCSLLGMVPDNKYEATWEEVANRADQLVADAHRQEGREQLALMLLLTFALGNADCHTKNVALLYSGLEDVRVAPIYDMLSIRVYERYADNPPGLSVGGRKAWDPGKVLTRFLRERLGFEPQEQRHLIERVCEAVTETLPELLTHGRETPGFHDVAARMVNEWNDGLKRLSKHTGITVADLNAVSVEQGLEPKQTRPARRRTTGHSELLGRRSKLVPPS